VIYWGGSRLSNNQHDDDKTQSLIVFSEGPKVGHYRIILKIGAGGIGSGFLLLILLLLFVLTCGVPKPSDEDWLGNDKTLWITVKSTPSGADVYGVVDGQKATLIGQTPITLKFWKADRTQEPVIWQSPHSDVSMEEILDHSIRLGSIHYSDMPGPDDSRFARYRYLVSDRNRNKEKAQFHCFVVKEGYEVYLLEDTYKTETEIADYPNIFKGHKTYVVPLTRIGSEKPLPSDSSRRWKEITNFGVIEMTVLLMYQNLLQRPIAVLNRELAQVPEGFSQTRPIKRGKPGYGKHRHCRRSAWMCFNEFRQSPP
jgi:hypothetical protein